MSYLNLPRLVFTGDFRSDVSTVNNDPAHYNNVTFQSSFQKPGPSGTNGWWNPEGGASFDFSNCAVRQVTMPDGTVSNNDVIIGCKVSSADDRAGGKMVDLDPQQQMVSQLWSVTLKISTVNGDLLFQGEIEPTSFRDLQRRQTAGANINGQPLGASWTSVLTNIEWGEKAESSPFLTVLRRTTQGNKLSLNLNGFGYYYNHAADGRFSLGRMLGSIAPWFESEPDLFAPARRLYGIFQLIGNTYFNFTNFLFEAKQKRLTLDFGASFPVSDTLGAISDPVIPNATGIIAKPQKFLLGVVRINPGSGLPNIAFAPDRQPQMLGKDEFTAIGELDFETGAKWLKKTGGIVVFEDLPDNVVGQLGGQPLVLLSPSANPDQFVIIAREAINGLVVRADNCVQRIDYGQTNTVKIYAYQYGTPIPSQEIAISLEPPTPVTPVGPNNPISEIPGNNYPADGISFPPSIETDTGGCAELSITGNAINNPRGYIDGQIYFLDYQLQGVPVDPASDTMVPENISIHLRDYFEIPENPTWENIAEIMTQFSNLYPIMSKYVVDLKDPVAVKAKKNILIFAFTRDIKDPVHMPVTRDLSDAKRQTILKWLESPGEFVETELLATAKAEKAALESSPPEAKLTERQIRFQNLTREKSGAEFLNNDEPEISEDN